MLDGFSNATRVPELRKRLLFTAGALLVYRIGVSIPTPGIDATALKHFVDQQRPLLGMVFMFTGGALERFSIFALGIMPYISASIILQLLTVVIPYLEKLSKEGELGRRKITQYTRYGTVALSLVQSLFISMGLESIPAGGGSVVFNPGWHFRFVSVITLTTGTAFIMWLGEQITERGIGNGISLIIFAGIVAAMPSAFGTVLTYVRQGELSPLRLAALLVLMVATVAFIIYMERAQRRIPVQYAKRVVGRRMYSGQSSHLPLKVNTSGVIPPIFASSLLLFPNTITGFIDHPIADWVKEHLQVGGPLYTILYVGLIIFFCYFYTAVTFNPTDVADNMKKFGGYIPGIRPGPRTAEYIERILARITLPGALYVAAVCVLPTILIRQYNVPFYFGGTALLIVVGVALDTIAAMETHLITRSYEGFMKRGRLRGRR
ncbi:MAG TPA: preprotein translocase subunit SecY [Candidatus Binatia bacterium]|nr:preprotein translocase subunit SecY [Candidatus Binatia bacterium]